MSHTTMNNWRNISFNLMGISLLFLLYSIYMTMAAWNLSNKLQTAYDEINSQFTWIQVPNNLIEQVRHTKDGAAYLKITCEE